MRFIYTLAVSAVVMLACTLAPSATVYANTVTVCSPEPITAATTQVGGSYQETLTSSGLITGGACSSVQLPPTGASTCNNGQAGDIPGYTALCYGSFVRHAGACNPQQNGSCPTIYGPFSFANVFGAWPGTQFAHDEIFSPGRTQFISIPFVPTPGHSVSFFQNQTYQPGTTQSVYSISTAPGLFNHGVANGTTVICAQGRNPNLTTSSNGTAGVGCVLSPGKQYWLNMVAGVVFNGVFTPCPPTEACKIAVQEQLQN